MKFAEEERMVPYLLFAGNKYYPYGGANDLEGRFDTLDEAIAAHTTKQFTYSCGWANVLCLDSLKIVKKFRRGTWHTPEYEE